jgi:hypothetical protein
MKENNEMEPNLGIWEWWVEKWPFEGAYYVSVYRWEMEL